MSMHIPSRHPSSRPFMASPRPQFYHPAAAIDAALRGTERCIRRAEGVALVVGAPGMGKSLLLAKVAEHVRDDFDVALLSGASICTRRALWQAVMAAIGEPFRGIDEAELRIALVERVRGLAATGSGLVILVDEAHTLPTRLIEELRLLTNVPTPLPAVHIVLAGSTRLEEMLAAPRMESLAQRIAVRGYLEPLDHTETLAYLRTQTKAAGLAWEKLFAPGSDDAVFQATDGVPRLINQLCDQALVLVAESNRLVTPADIAAAWREIQRLPAHGLFAGASGDASVETPTGRPVAPDESADSFAENDGMGVIEFGGDGGFVADEPASQWDTPAPAPTAAADDNPWCGPDVELVFDQEGDPFEELFIRDRGADAGNRVVVEGPDDFSSRQPVESRDGQTMARVLAKLARTLTDAAPRPAAEPALAPAAAPETPAPAPSVGDCATDGDDADMVVIEDDDQQEFADHGAVFSVRPGDYRRLFTRLRRGDGNA
jgi:type II secretory pathway predicted ATPase ExeA